MKHFSSSHTYYKDPLFFLSPFLHRILPGNMSRIVMLDIDLRFDNDVKELYRLFNQFNRNQILGIYHKFKGHCRIRLKICHSLIFYLRYFEKKEHEILYISLYFFCLLLNAKADSRRTNSLWGISLSDFPNDPIIFSFANLP